jgi:TP901 family phage tail tape measure protein
MQIDQLVISVKSQGISDAKRQLDQLTTSADNTEKKVKKLVDAVDDMVKKFSSGSSAVAAMTQAMSVVNKSTQASDAAMKSLSSSITALSRQIENLNKGMASGVSAVRTSTVNITHHTATMSDAHAAARGLTGSLGALWLTYGNAAPLAAGAAIGASMKQIISIGTEVEHTLENIRIKGENTAEGIQEMRKALVDLGQGIYGPQEITKALETLTLAGLKSDASVKAVGAARNLAIVGGTDINRAAESLVTIGTAFGATADQFDYVSDGIAKAANISLASVESISEAVKRASVVNKLYGASFEDVLTQTAALAQLGIKNSAAGTAITNFYANAMGNTEKAKAALDALGFSFQDATGKAKPLVAAYEEFTSKLNQFDQKSQQKLITEIFGERALRDVEGIRDMVNSAAESTERLADGTLKYKNRLEEVQAQIQSSSGTAALQAAQLAQTTENQVKTMINTLKSSFGEAFTAIEPQIRDIVKGLTDMFKSEQFKSFISGVSQGFINLAKILSENVDLIKTFVEIMIAGAAANAGFALFSAIARGIQLARTELIAYRAAMIGVEAATIATTVATGALSTALKFLPGIGLVLGAVTAVFTMMSLEADKAAKSTSDLAEEAKKAAATSNQDFINSLEEEAKRLELVNEKLAKGVALQTAEIQVTKELALEKQKAAGQKSVELAQKALDEARARTTPEMIASYNRNRFSFTASEEYPAVIALMKAQKDLEAAKKEANKADERSLELLLQIEGASAWKQKQMEVDAYAKSLLQANKAGEKTFTGDKDKSKGPNFFEQLIDSSQKWIDGHQARVNALRKEIETGIAGEEGFYKAQAEANLTSREAEIASTKLAAAKVAEYQAKIRANAATADEVKFVEKQLNTYNDLLKSVRDRIKGNNEYYDSIISNSDVVIGKYSKELSVAAQRAGMTAKQIEFARQLGVELDKQLKINDEIQKIESLTKGSNTRAEQYAAQAKALGEYGSKAKSTALDLAQATVAQMSFANSAEELKAQAYLAAAALETVNKALMDINKIGATAAEETAKLEAESLLMFETREKEKVRIKAESIKKQIDMDLEVARRAAVMGDPAAIAAYQKAVEDAVRAKETIDKNSAIKMHNVELEDWKKTVNNIVDETLKGFDNIFDKGTSIWKSLTTSIKNMFKSTILDYIKKEFAKPIVLNVVASVAGSMGFSGIANTAQAMLGGSSGGAMGAVNGVSGIASLLSGGLTSTVGGAATAIGNMIGSSTLSAIGSGISGGAGITDAIAAYTAAGDAATASALSLGSTISAALPWVAGIAAGVALLSKAFGMGPKQITATGIRGSVADNGVSGESYADWMRKGGWFRSDKRGTDTSTLPTDVGNSLLTSFSMLKNTASNFAQTVGVSSNALDGFTKSFDIAFGSDQQKNQEALTKFFKDLSDEMSTKLVPNISDFALQGETASTTLERLSKVFDSTNTLAKLLGKSVESLFGSKGLDSAKVRQSLVDIAGGVDALTSKTSAYISAIYTDAEKLEPVKKALNEAFSSLGMRVPETKEAFKSVVDGLNLQDVAQQKMYVSLTELAPAFAQVIDAQDALAKAAEEDAAKQRDLYKDKLSIQMQIAELEKNENAIKLITNEQRKLELETMEQSLIPWQERLNVLKDEKAALEKATAFAKDKLSLELEIANASKDQAAAYAITYQQRLMEIEATEEGLRPLKRRLYAIQDEAAAIDKANAIRDKSLSMQLSIAEYQKDDVARTAILAKQRAIEMQSMDASLRPLQERINAIEDEKRALDDLRSKANTALDRLKTAVQKQQDIVKDSYEKQIDTTKDSYSKQIEAVKDSTDAQIKWVKASADAQERAVKDSADAQIDEYKKQKDVAQESLSAIKQVFDALSNAIESAKIESYALDKARRQSAQQLIRASRGMDVTKIGGLDNALKDISSPSTKFFKTFEEYAVDQAQTASDLAGLRDDAQSQMDLAQLTIDKLDATIENIQKTSEAQIQAIKDSADASVAALEAARDMQVVALEEARDKEITALEAARDAELNALDQIIQTAQVQLDALNGINSSVLSVRDAVSGFQTSFTALQSQMSAVAAAAARPVIIPQPVSTQIATPGANTGLNDLYQSLLGRAPDMAGLDYWANSMIQNGLSLTDVAASIVSGDEYKNLHHFDVGTNFIPEDMPAMLHHGERVIPAADNAELMRRLDSDEKQKSQNELVQAINSLEVSLRAGDLAVNQKLTEVVRIVKRWDGEGMPGTRPGAVVTTTSV